ncbi:hypothetical protein UlMin_025615 [Ulmus minor]
MVETNRSAIPLLLFNGENYEFWSIKMRTYFCSQNLWKVVEERLTVPDDTSTLTTAQKKVLDESIQKDSQALFAIQQAMSEEIFPRIMSATTVKEAWDTLQEEFQEFKKYVLNQMTKDETIFCNIDKIKTKVKIGNCEFVKAIGKGTIVDKSLIIARVKMQENMCFPIQWRYAIDTTMKAQVDESWLWHRRFGHFNFHGLKILWQKNMMRDLPTIKEIDETYEGCMLGKQHRQPFLSKKAWRAKKSLKLVHTDVCNPMRIPSNDQNRYFILFVDDYTRMTWFCEDKGVRHQLTVGYAPEQNGVSKRKNKNVMETARAMLMEKGLPKTFWAEAVYTIVYLLNRCPTNAVKDMTAVEAWSGRKPSAKHLKVFGCICYAHIPQEKRSKLDEKTKKGIFLGYSTKSKGYRVYSLRTKKLIISRDV